MKLCMHLWCQGYKLGKRCKLSLLQKQRQRLFFLRPPKPHWGFSRSPAKPSFMNPTSWVSCYAVSKTVGIFRGFARHTTSIQWIIWDMFCSCQKPIPVWHSTKQKKAVHKRATTTVFTWKCRGHMSKKRNNPKHATGKDSKGCWPFH